MVWSGQHYDYEMSRIFFEELKLPDPDIYLERVKEYPDILDKLSQIIVELKQIVRREKPRLIYGLGDTTTTLAAAITAAYEKIPFVHDESGMRSFDFTMIEEINRIIADRLAFLHLAPTKLAVLNLLTEGTQLSSIRLVGSTLVDTLIYVLQSPLVNLGEKRLSEIVSIDSDEHVVTLTLHRRENLTCERLKILIRIISKISNLKELDIKLLIPIHPHTKKTLEECGLINKLQNLENVLLIKPLGYLEAISLLRKSRLIITDSGGIQQEAFILGKYTITLRNTTEWLETVILGYNNLVNLDEASEERILMLIKEMLNKVIPAPNLETSPIGDGKSSTRIVKILENMISGTESKAEGVIGKSTAYSLPAFMISSELAESHKLCSSNFIDVLSAIANLKGAGTCMSRVQVKLDALKRMQTQITVNWDLIDKYIP